MPKIHKVQSLPDVLVGNDIYLEKKGDGAVLHVTNLAGTAALTIKDPIHLNGPTELFHGEVGEYTIQSYSDQNDYVFNSLHGEVSRIDDKIYFVSTNPLYTTASFIVNGRTFTITMKPVLVVAPTVQSPTQNASNVGVTGTIAYGSAFDLNFDGASDVHVSSDWELSTDPDFTTIVASSYNSTTNLTSWLLP